LASFYHVTPSNSQKLALTSPTSSGRSVSIVRLRIKSHGEHERRICCKTIPSISRLTQVQFAASYTTSCSIVTCRYIHDSTDIYSFFKKIINICWLKIRNCIILEFSLEIFKIKESLITVTYFIFRYLLQ
jgi:hypothetical protein